MGIAIIDNYDSSQRAFNYSPVFHRYQMNRDIKTFCEANNEAIIDQLAKETFPNLKFFYDLETLVESYDSKTLYPQVYEKVNSIVQEYLCDISNPPNQEKWHFELDNEKYYGFIDPKKASEKEQGALLESYTIFEPDTTFKHANGDKIRAWLQQLVNVIPHGATSDVDWIAHWLSPFKPSSSVSPPRDCLEDCYLPKYSKTQSIKGRVSILNCQTLEERLRSPYQNQVGEDKPRAAKESTVGTIDNFTRFRDSGSKVRGDRFAGFRADEPNVEPETEETRQQELLIQEQMQKIHECKKRKDLGICYHGQYVVEKEALDYANNCRSRAALPNLKREAIKKVIKVSSLLGIAAYIVSCFCPEEDDSLMGSVSRLFFTPEETLFNRFCAFV